MLSESNTNPEKRNFQPALKETIQHGHIKHLEKPQVSCPHKTEQVLSADNFILLKQKLEKSRNQVANLEKEIYEGGELTKDEISPLWSNFSLEDSVNKQSKQVLSADDFLSKVKELKHHRNKVANLEKEICQGGELTTDAISPLWSNISHSQNNQKPATEQ